MKRILYLLYQPYKWLVFYPYLVLSTLFFAFWAILLALFTNAKTASFIGGVIWARMNTYLTPVFVKVVGRENIDKKQSYIIVSNHQSSYDIFVLYGWLGIDIKWIMKRELKKIPALGIAAGKVGHIYIDRSKREAALTLLDAAKSKAVDGTSLVFFPEGTRSKDGKVGSFQKGAFKMAIDLGLPILPITIMGTKDILPSGTMDLFPGRVKMIIHKPVDVAGYSYTNIRQLMGRVREIIGSGLDKKM